MAENEFLSRNEKILRKILGEDIELDEPQSRIEALLQQLLDLIGAGGSALNDLFIVNYTPAEGSEHDGQLQLTADKTAHEIYEAYVTGKRIIGVYSPVEYTVAVFGLSYCNKIDDETGYFVNLAFTQINGEDIFAEPLDEISLIGISHSGSSDEDEENEYIFIDGILIKSYRWMRDRLGAIEVTYSNGINTDLLNELLTHERFGVPISCKKGENRHYLTQHKVEAYNESKDKHTLIFSCSLPTNAGVKMCFITSEIITPRYSSEIESHTETYEEKTIII